MDKAQIRLLKNHYQSRWAVLRHNQKYNQKVLLLNDLFVLKNLLPGETLCYNCLGEMYQGIIPGLSVVANKRYNNLVLINNIEFKYKTLDQLTLYLEQITDQFALNKSRVVISLSQKYLIYDRVGISVKTLLDSWAYNLKKFKLVNNVSLLGSSQPGYGEHFFCFEYHG